MLANPPEHVGRGRHLGRGGGDRRASEQSAFFRLHRLEALAPGVRDAKPRRAGVRRVGHRDDETTLEQLVDEHLDELTRDAARASNFRHRLVAVAQQPLEDGALRRVEVVERVHHGGELMEQSADLAGQGIEGVFAGPYHGAKFLQTRTKMTSILSY